MIYAITIYNLAPKLDNICFQKVLYASESNITDLFRYSPFKQLDEVTLPLFISADRQLYKIYDIEAKKEFHYFQKIAGNIVIAVSTKNALDPLERVNLFKNIEHVYLRSKKLKITLDDIIKNPMGYTGRDILIGYLQKNVDLAMQEACLAIEKLDERGENLDDLVIKAENLKVLTDVFVEETVALNSCCGKW